VDFSNAGLFDSIFNISLSDHIVPGKAIQDVGSRFNNEDGMFIEPMMYNVEFCLLFQPEDKI
jgi:hypothetical protein